MKILLMAVGRTRSALMRQAIDEYLTRLGHYDSPVEVKIIDDVTKGRKAAGKLGSDAQKEAQKLAEGEALLRCLTPADRVILLDERGRQPTSREFAEMIDRMITGGTRRVAFVVGGPYGFSPAVYARADGQLSLSRMTFSHEMVRLFFVEQLYRAQTIRKGEPYHHD